MPHPSGDCNPDSDAARRRAARAPNRLDGASISGAAQKKGRRDFRPTPARRLSRYAPLKNDVPGGWGADESGNLVSRLRATTIKVASLRGEIRADGRYSCAGLPQRGGRAMIGLVEAP
jgi:hypothetical protein